ncbi:MAG: uroporphyrinogen-III C-methyltransferase, partial [Pseudomonadota bacterium]
STLRGISTGARDAWLLAQAEYYLQVANAELGLANNPDIATRALELADERLLTISDPGLTDVRRTLSAELRALESMPKPDIAGAAVTLASLSRVVDSLPIRQQLLTKQPNERDTTGDNSAEALSGTDRAMATLRDAFSGIVSIRRTDEEAVPLIAPEAVYFLRTNLSLQLQAARLALLQNDQTLFGQSLDDAELWLRDYYDMESTPVRSALATLDEVRTGMLIEPAPDISESLRLLRQYIAFTNAGRPEARRAPEPAPRQEPETDPEPGISPDADPPSEPEPDVATELPVDSEAASAEAGRADEADPR